MNPLKHLPRVKTHELKLADKVIDPEHPDLGVIAVKNIDGNIVKLFRPYPTTADFNYTGGVICYVGIEEFDRWRSDGADWIVVSRTDLK